MQESLAAVSAEAWILGECFCDLTLTGNAYISGMLAGFHMQLFNQPLLYSL